MLYINTTYILSLYIIRHSTQTRIYELRGVSEKYLKALTDNL